MSRAAWVLALVAALTWAAPASAQTAGSTPTGATAQTLTVVPPDQLPPPGRASTAKEVSEAALRAPRIRRLLREHPGAFQRAYLKPDGAWQVSVFERGSGGEREIGQVLVDDGSLRVLEAWTGVQVAWTMARGYEGAFGRRASALYIWLALLAAFLVPLARPPWRLVHLDLLAIASLSVSFAFFNHAEIGASVPLAYPPLVYLLVRMLLLARARARTDRVPPPLPVLGGTRWLGLAIVFLVGFRLGLNATASNVIDVGYAGVIGADRIAHGDELYGSFPPDNPRGDTYGPLNYLAYVPFELALPWRGEWDDLPAAHVAAAVFDLACVALLWLLGRRLHGPRTGLLLAYLWLACPFTLLVANSGANDSLVAAVVLAALALAARPAARGAAIAAAGMTKFAPLALGPLFATYDAATGENRARAIPAAAAGGAVALAALLAVVTVLDGGLGGLWDRAIAFQAGRESPFSVWGWYDLGALQPAAQAGAVALALAVAVVPRRRDPVTLAALAAAVLLALQLAVDHWFHLYVVWFLPLVLLCAVSAVDAAPARSSPPAPAASSGSAPR